MKKELRYYVPLIMGFALMLIGIFTPPVGVITTGVLYGGGMFLCLCAAVVGADIPAILHEIRLLKENTIKSITKDIKEQSDETN